MSHYIAKAFDPITKTVREAWWMDDYYGRHNYGVQFDDGGPIYRPREVEIPEHLKEEKKPTSRYARASEALDAAHKACFNHPDRTVLGMSEGPFSGVNVALGIIRELEELNAALEGRIERLEEELKEKP